MHGWQVNNGQKYIAVGSSAVIEVSAGDSDFFDVTPTGFTSGTISSTETQDSTTWSMDNWGQNMVAVSDADQTIYAQDVGTYLSGTEYITNPDFDSGPNWMDTIRKQLDGNHS